MAEIKLKMGLLNDLSSTDLDGGSVYFAKNKTVEKEDGEDKIKYTYGELYYDEVIKDDQTEQDIITRVKISPSIEQIEYVQKKSDESGIESLTSKIILEDHTIISNIIPFASINFPGIISTSEQDIQGNKNFFSNITVNQMNAENTLPIQKFKVDTDGNIDTFGNIIIDKTETENNQKITIEKFKVDTDGNINTFGNIIVKKTETENNEKVTLEKFKVDTDGNIFANSLTITNQNDIGHIVFTRNNQNYIQLPEESSIGFLFGENKIADYCSLLISKNNFIINKVEKINDEITTSTTNFILDTDGNINTFGNIIVKKNEEKDNEIISVEKFKVDTDGNIFANSLTITNQDPIGHIIFTRSNQNYIQSPVNSAIGFLFNETKEADKCSLLINKDNLKPGTTNTIDLGSNSSRWKNIYTINLNTCNGNIIVSKTKTTNNITFTDINLTIDENGNITPGVGNTNNLGSNSQSWKNVYTTNLNVVNYNSTDSDKQGYTTLIKEPSKDNYSLTLPSGNGKIPHMMSDNSDINPGGIIYGAVRRGEKGDIIEEAYACTPAGTASYLLKSNGENAPSWIQKVPIANGGTNAITAAGARQNINYIGTNPITVDTNDTPQNWNDLGPGVAYYNKKDYLKGQPSTYGFLINQVTGGTACCHIWTSTAGEVYARGYSGETGMLDWKHLLSTKSAVTKNRMVWARDTNELFSGNHWVSENNVGINLIEKPDATLGVGGNIQATDNISAIKSTDTSVQVYAENSKGSISILASWNGNRGLYHKSAGNWIIYYNLENNRIQQATTYFAGAPYITTSEYMPTMYFQSSSAGDKLPMGRISHLLQASEKDENYTTSRMYFYHYSYNKDTRTRVNDAEGNGIYERFRLPKTSENLTTSATYDILTSKNYPDDRYVNIDGDTMTGALAINNTTTSESTSTGALVVTGGIGVAGQSYFGTVYTGSLHPKTNNEYALGSESFGWSSIRGNNIYIRDNVNNYTGGRFYTTASTSTESQPTYLIAGNSAADGTAGSRYGLLRLYAKSAYYHTFQSSAASSHKTITIPNYTGIMTISHSEAYDNTSSSTYYMPFYMNSTNGRIGQNSGMKYMTLQGAAATSSAKAVTGYGYFILGNSIASGTDGNKYGALRLYSTSSGYMNLRASSTTSSYTHYLPAVSGTLLNTKYIVGSSSTNYGTKAQREALTPVTGQIFFQLV